MSRIGKTPVNIPSGVTVSVGEGNLVTVKGPKGTLSRVVRPEIAVNIDGSVINVTRSSDLPLHRAMHGLSRSLIANMVTGVTDGFKKELEINGVGYRAAKDGQRLVMNLGYSHQVIIEETNGITIDVPAPNRIVVNGIDKQAVGQFAADIRGKRPPEPYLGKGIKYANEVIRRKEGKTGTK
jgi:large subunit ribosomal protein L6